MSLNWWLRSNGYTDAKRMCGEGGCGACAVVLTFANPNTAVGGNTTVAVNSCLRPLAACDGVAVTTTSGIGNQRAGFHPIQQRLADNAGSQCGMCSPGMVRLWLCVCVYV